MESIDRYKALANAIILQAVNDYRQALKGDAQGWQREIEEFFHSEWFTVLTEVNPDWIIQRLRQEVDVL